MDAPLDLHVEKKAKLNHDSSTNASENHEAGDHVGSSTISLPLETFRSFALGRVLNETPDKKLIFVQGKFAGSDEDAVVILEKTPFKQDVVAKILSQQTTLKNTQHNDIYSTYEGFPPVELNGKLFFS